MKYSKIQFVLFLILLNFFINAYSNPFSLNSCKYPKSTEYLQTAYIYCTTKLLKITSTSLTTYPPYQDSSYGTEIIHYKEIGATTLEFSNVIYGIKTKNITPNSFSIALLENGFNN